METNTSPSQAGLKYGLYGGIAILLWSLISYLAGLSDPTSADPGFLQQWLPTILMIITMVLGIRYFKESNEGYLSIGQGIVTAIIAGLIMTLISIIWMVVYFYFIDPEAIETLRANVMEKAMEDNNLTEEQMESASGMMGMFTSVPFFAIAGLIMSVIVGLIIGLITSLIMKNTPEA